MQSFTFSRKKNPKLSRKVYIFGGRKLKKLDWGGHPLLLGVLGHLVWWGVRGRTISLIGKGRKVRFGTQYDQVEAGGSMFTEYI